MARLKVPYLTLESRSNRHRNTGSRGPILDSESGSNGHRNTGSRCPILDSDTLSILNY